MQPLSVLCRSCAVAICNLRLREPTAEVMAPCSTRPDISSLITATVSRQAATRLPYPAKTLV